LRYVMLTEWPDMPPWHAMYFSHPATAAGASAGPWSPAPPVSVLITPILRGDPLGAGAQWLAAVVEPELVPAPDEPQAAAVAATMAQMTVIIGLGVRIL
jgi:hypothetical protein